jgi:tRNA pseudouridine38-40 synthase
VQAVITGALEVLTREKINLIGAGRTDTGVHALGQIGNFRTEKILDAYKTRYSINSLLPPEISVTELVAVPESFHSRFDATSRVYWYLLTNERSPFYRKYTCFYPYKLRADVLNKYARQFIGDKDYQSFAKELPENGKTNCLVTDARWREAGDKLLFRIEANRFLHSMVRLVVGTQLRFLKDGKSPEEIESVFKEPEKRVAGPSVPAHGLFLVKVNYGNNNKF